jgi:hypothetical protein
MALLASHLRFSTDIKDQLKASDPTRYFSGTAYPDSRYATGLDRTLTHPADFRTNSNFMSDDFRKGWYSHLIYDVVQRKCTDNSLSHLLTGDNKELFAKYTALKILQDIDDAHSFDLNHHLGYLTDLENPNGEDPVVLSEYYNFNCKVYSHLPILNKNSYDPLFHRFSVGKEMIKMIKHTVDEFQNNQEVKSFLTDIYPKSLALYRNISES